MFLYRNQRPSGVAMGGVKGGIVPPQQKNAKNQENEGENQEKEEKNGKVLSLCSSWQIGLAMLLKRPMGVYW